ncbi:MAG TPA: DUF1707 domain-containing protein [Solirubrobacteraceae bacterium]|nr:DUF1707 domain-containing protein [Solirubrobacteraceae bacterium]
MYGYETISQMIRNPNLRASDADRDAMADRLRKHHTDGRLDQEEFQERLDKCFAAKTVGELAELTRDLPDDAARHREDGRAGLRLFGCLRMIPIVPIIVAIVAIHLIFGVVGSLWVLIPLFFLARVMFFRRGFGRWSGRRGAAL